MNQQSLFEEALSTPIARASSATPDWKATRPIARRSDPESSHEAAEQITKSGKRKLQALEVLALVRKYPLSTSLELAHKSRLDRYQIARRLSEEQRLVNRRAARICTVAKTRKAVTWESL